MSKDDPTPAQQAVLQLLSHHPALSNHEIHLQIGAGITDRATRQLLDRLAARQWIGRAPAERTQGGDINTRWRLLPAGAKVGYLPLPPPLPRPARPLRATPTQEQQDILNLLADVAYLSTAEIHSYVLRDHASRTLRRVLATCQEYGWVRMYIIDSEQGSRASRYWTLTAAGARAGGLPPPSRAALPNLGSSKAITLRASELDVLHLLAHWKALRTSQIASYLYPHKPQWYTARLLGMLAARHLVAGKACAEGGTTMEYYWHLRARGAAALHLEYDKHYRRRPSDLLLDWRGQQLTLIRTAYATGWQIYYPDELSLAPLAPAKAPLLPYVTSVPELSREEYVVEAVVALELARLDQQVANGRAHSNIDEEYNRLQHRQLGALVPAPLKEYVVYIPGRPDLTAILILHPPYAGVSFWNRPPDPGKTPQIRKPESRLDRYHRLAKVLPIFGIFDDLVTLHDCAPLLTPHALQPILLADLEPTLRRMIARPP